MRVPIEIQFRGEEVTIIVDEYEYEYDTNALIVSWHFDDDALNSLDLTNEEDDYISECIDKKMQEYDGE